MDEKELQQQDAGEDALNPEEPEKTDEFEESEESSVETDETDELDEDIDYEAELEKERERLGKKIDKERSKRIEAQKEFMPREEAEKLISEKVGEVQKQMLRERATMLAEKLANSQAEKDLIMLHYDKSIIPSGNLEEDIDNAYTLANKKRFRGQISELLKAAQSKKNIQTGGEGAGAPVRTEKPAKYSQEIIDGAKFAGVSPKEFVERQKK